MKAISIQQPWGSLIAHGVKDVENRTSRMLVPPQRVLIHVGAKARASLDDLYYCWELPVENAEIIGQFDRDEPLPFSAIIGYVDVVDIVDNSESVWAEYAPEGAKPVLHYVLKNAKLFKEPILNVKGRLGVWDIPEIDENNLPETVDLPKIERKGKTLVVPCAPILWNNVVEWIENPEDEFILSFNLLDDNLNIFTDEELEPLETTKVVFTRDGSSYEVDIDEALIEGVYDEGADEPIKYEYPSGDEHISVYITYVAKPGK